MSKKFVPSDYLSDEINLRIMQSERDGGMWLRDIKLGQIIKVVTKNTEYIIEKVANDKYIVSGNKKYCPVPTFMFLHGSTFGGSMIRVGFIGVGMYLEMYINNKPILTSHIKSVEVLQ